MTFTEARDFLADHYADTGVTTYGQAVDILTWARRKGYAYAGAYIVRHGPASDTFTLTPR